MMITESMDDEELKRLRRDAAIRARENDFKRKQQEEEEAKREQLENLKKEYEMLEQTRLQERLRLLQKQADIRAQKKAEIDKLVKKRNDVIEKRNRDWLERTNAKIHDIIEEHQEEERIIEENQEAARQRKKEKEEKQRLERQERSDAQHFLNQKRLQAQMAKESVRRQKELKRVDALKAEAHEELQSFIQNPFPVPLKQVIAGRMRPVPTVTELLAIHKDQREMLKQLEAQDVPMRALMRNQSLFRYVRDLELEAEANSVKPPEPAGMGGTKKSGAGGTKRNFAFRGR
jgi:chromosome segregation ATPase